MPFLKIHFSRHKSESSNLVLLFKKFGVLTVIGAGLIDGYNPCAITVLIFFISLLALRKKTEEKFFLLALFLQLA